MKKMFIFIGVLGIFFSSCDENRFTSIGRVEEPTIYTAEQNDEIINQAILTAQQTIREFDSAFLSKDPSCTEFSLKLRFDAEDGGGEHLWLNGITISNSNYYGIVNNIPEFTTDVKLGDFIEIKREAITDWMYLKDGVLSGGHTIRAIRNQMTAKEKESFDTEIGFKIED